MATGPKALITPDILIWARVTAGLSLEVVAEKMQIDSQRLESWEQGTDQPTISQLRHLSSIYKRPIAVFYLPVVPKNAPRPPRDFRRLPSTGTLTASPELIFEIRRASQRRAVAIELYEELGETPVSIQKEISLSDDPERVGTEIRALVGLTYAEQVKWKDPGKAFNWWRAAIEALGILVFQAVGVEVSEMRGFSIHDKPLSIIAVNIKDSERGRIFSMLHELVHILLREGGVCTLHETHLRTSLDQRIEVFCNKVAGATLIPKEYLELEEVVANRVPQDEWLDKELTSLRYRYQASKEAILRRLLTFGYTSEAFYQMKREELQQDNEAKEKGERTIIILQHNKAINRLGIPFTKLVLEGYYREKITPTELSDVLDLRLKHLHNLEQSVFG